jgi:hypothetical protein
VPIETASAKSAEVEHVTAGEPMQQRPLAGGPARQAAKVRGRPRAGGPARQAAKVTSLAQGAFTLRQRSPTCRASSTVDSV